MGLGNLEGLSIELRDAKAPPECGDYAQATALPPDRARPYRQDPGRLPADHVSLKTEGVADRRVDRQKSLRDDCDLNRPPSVLVSRWADVNSRRDCFRASDLPGECLPCKGSEALIHAMEVRPQRCSPDQPVGCEAVVSVTSARVRFAPLLHDDVEDLTVIINSAPASPALVQGTLPCAQGRRHTTFGHSKSKHHRDGT